MADSDEDLETRVAILEQEVARLREQAVLHSSDAAAARVLAAGADRDVSEVRSELRAHTRVLNALRETQLELQATQLELRETQLEQGEAIISLRQDVTGLDQKMSAGFATLNTGMRQITALLIGITGTEQD